MARIVSRVFLQAWVLLLLDPEDRSRGRVGGLSDQFLIRRMLEFHRRLYPEVHVTWREIATFLRHERESPTGILTSESSARDNFLCWENISVEVRDVRGVLIARLARCESVVARDRQEQSGRDDRNDILHVLGLN